MNEELASGPNNVASKGAISDASQSNTNAEAEQFIPPPPSELVKACQTGDLNRIKELFDNGEASAGDIEPDGTSALHWAAINNRLNICLFLLENGAQVDSRGGDLAATPLHWAAKYGLVYIVHLLIQHGADPLRSDSQGFNALHLAVHSSNVLLVIYLLHQELPVDTPDPSGRTALHWAAYQGDSLTVDALLKWGADVKLTDSLGFTPLHWAIVKGSRVSIKRLLQEGSDLNAKSNDGKSTALMAEEMNTRAALYGALSDVGRKPDGSPVQTFLSKKATDGVIFFSSFISLPISWYLLSSYIWFVSVPLTLVMLYSYMKFLSTFIVPNAYHGSHVWLQTPLYAGIFFNSAAWVWIRYLGFVLPNSYFAAPVLNLLFVCLFLSATASFLTCMLMDPGYVPKLSGITEQREVIEQLLDLGEYDATHFCLATYIRKPLRSKYDRQSKRVVAKFDHVCPWVNNVIGARNHRYFVIFTVSLFFGIPLLEYLFFWYALPSYTSGIKQTSEIVLEECSILPNFLCTAFQVSPFTSVLMIWCLLQLSWVVLLVFVQLVQISRGVTSNEAINLQRFGSYGGEEFSSLPQDHRVNHRLMLEKMATANPTRERRCWSPLFRLIGLDLFLSTASSAVHDGNRNSSNPANYGFFTNCSDFWAPNGDYNIFKAPKGAIGSLGGQSVDYTKLWEYPAHQDREYEMISQV